MPVGEVADILEMDRALWAISSPPGGPRSATPETDLVIWRWPLEGANKGKTANEAKRNETETRHEANRSNERQATEHDNTKQNGTRRDETKAAAPTAKPQGGEGGEGEGEGEAGGRGNGPVQESCGPGWEARPT